MRGLARDRLVECSGEDSLSPDVVMRWRNDARKLEMLLERPACLAALTSTALSTTSWVRARRWVKLPVAEVTSKEAFLAPELGQLGPSGKDTLKYRPE